MLDKIKAQNKHQLFEECLLKVLKNIELKIFSNTWRLSSTDKN